ncbi:MAG: hypothetical protein IPP72_08880 [Chitinophagaceae bacterium]|nr:hypothetical protein [Chitinophagaceae bacterium]
MAILKYFIVVSFTMQYAVTIYAQKETIVPEEGNIRCTYTIKDKRLTGNYNSFYENGVKKSEGRFVNGYRYGKWTVWDSTGRERMERFYKNPFEYERIFPPIPNEGPIPILATNQYPLKYDSNNIIKYAKIDVSDAIWRHKYWKRLSVIENKTLFENKRLLKIFCNLIKEQKAEAYSTEDDRFTTTIKMDTLDIDQAEFIGLDMKEEAVFDINRLIFEYRILGFCPIVKYKGYEGQIFWIYFPDVRKYLGKESVTSNNSFIKTLDDLFIFRDFGSVITKTTANNPMDLPLSKYQRLTSTDEIKQAEIEELNIIEQENNIWISLTR